MHPFHSLFTDQPETEYVPDIMGRLGQGDTVVKPDPGPIGTPNPRFDEFIKAERLGAGLTDLFGEKDTLAIKGPVGPVAPNRRADVGKVQTLLSRTGSFDLDPTDGPTGYYGTRLEDAITGFQSTNGLKADGLLKPGGKTIKTLANKLKDQIKPPTPLPKIAASLTLPGRGAGQKFLPLKNPGVASPEIAAAAPPTKNPLEMFRKADRESMKGFLASRKTKPASPLQPASKRVLTAAPKAEAQPFGNALWIDYQNTWLAAQQNTSPSVIGADGTYNYQRAPEEWQVFYQTHGVGYADVFVLLLDPANGQPTAWLRNPKMRESRFLGLSRVLSWTLLPGGISRAPRVARAGRAAAVAVPVTQRARLSLGGFLRNAATPLKATSPEQFFGDKLWNSFSPELQSLVRPRFSYFTGKAAEIKVTETLGKAGFTIRSKTGQISFVVEVNGKATTRIYDQLTDDKIAKFLSSWLARPAKSALPTGIEVKFASSSVLKSQTAKDAAAKEANKIIEARLMRMPADKVKRTHIAKAINEWLVTNKGSSVLTGRQRKAFEIMVGQLQKKRFADGSRLTLGGLMGLSLLLALKAQNQPLIPPPPKSGPFKGRKTLSSNRA